MEEIARKLLIARPAVSQHLKILKDAGLFDVETLGTKNIYRFNEAGIRSMQEIVRADGKWSRSDPSAF